MGNFPYDDSDHNTIPTMFTSAMKIKRSTYCCLGMISLTLAGFLSGCQDSEPKLTNPSPSASVVSPSPNTTPGVAIPSSPSGSSIPDVVTPSSAQEAPATISQIQKKPVWLKRLNTTAEISATEGMELFIGEQIRTVGEALAEIELKNGLAFRIGGNSVLTLQPDNSLNLSKGEMITWVQPGKQVPAKVVTPGAIAGIRGTTIYINIPDAPNSEIEYFTWEGTMSLKLPNQSEEMLLKAGEIVKVKPGETDINQMRKRVRQLTQKEWETRRHKSPLINNFVNPLPTLKKIDQVAPKETKKSTLAPKQSKLTAPQKVNNITASPTPKTPATPKVEVSLTPTPKQPPTPQVEVSLSPTPKQQAASQEQPVPRQILQTPYPKFPNPTPTFKTTPQANPKETTSSPNYR